MIVHTVASNEVFFLYSFVNQYVRIIKWKDK